MYFENIQFEHLINYGINVRNELQTGYNLVNSKYLGRVSFVASDYFYSVCYTHFLILKKIVKEIEKRKQEVPASFLSCLQDCYIFDPFMSEIPDYLIK